MVKKYKNVAIKYAKDVKSGKIIAGKEIILACERFLDDLKREDLELKTTEPDNAINIMQNTLVHQQGEDIEGNALQGKPFILEPWQIFIIYNLLGFYYKGTNKRRYKEAFIEIARKNGKSLSLDTEIPTPDGWKKMAEINVGDFVFSKNGKPTKVLVESEIFHKKMYLVTFEDGSSIKASADHLWTVQTKKSRESYIKRAGSKYKNTKGWFVVDTETMFKDFKYQRSDGKGIEYKYRVPMNEAVEYSKKDLPIEPYVLGLWLGDGSKNKPNICCCDEDKDEIMSYVSSCGYKIYWHDRKDRVGDFSIETAGNNKANPNPFTNKLKELKVFNNKHIPEIYMQGSVEQRTELLKGLMDTDGFCSKAGQCEFSQKDKRLSYQALELIRSLGIKATICGRYVKCNGKEFYSYRITFWTDKTFSCFKLKRKHERLKEKLSQRMKAKSITDVVEIPVEPSKCIMVDNEDSLYLASRSYTTTHNTSTIAGLAWAVSILQRHSGSKTYIVASALRQTLEAFNFITYSLKANKLDKKFRIRDNSFEHSIKYQFEKRDGTPDGSFEIYAMPTNPDAQDSFNCNFVIADEVASYKKPSQYNRFKEAMAAYENRLMIGITTAGDNINSFGYSHQEYCSKVVNGIVENDSLFVFIARADQDKNGFVDYTDPIQHQKANPNYGVTIRPQEMLNDSLQAQNDPIKRKDFLSRRLNIYTSSMRSWFDIDEFKKSDSNYNWTLDELAKLNINWYGGSDLSRMSDLTATALFGNYKGTDIIITHAFFPITQASKKAEEDNIPLFGWQDDGWLTMCNSPTVNMGDVVNWFIEMRKKGFKIKEVGHDRKFAGEEYFPLMRKAGFKVIDQPQYFYLKSQGFRHIEKSAKDGNLYYLHSEAYEYCVSNVRAVEKTDDAVMYEKINPTQRIDLFDASVFACIRYSEAETKAKIINDWFD